MSPALQASPELFSPCTVFECHPTPSKWWWMDGNGSMTNNCCVLVKVPAGFAAVGTHKKMRKLAAEENWSLQTLNLFLASRQEPQSFPTLLSPCPVYPFKYWLSKSAVEACAKLKGPSSWHALLVWAYSQAHKRLWVCNGPGQNKNQHFTCFTQSAHHFQKLQLETLRIALDAGTSTSWVVFHLLV